MARQMNWLMVVPLLATLGFFTLAGMRLASNASALEHGVDTTALPSAQEGQPAPPLTLDPLGQNASLAQEDLSSGELVIVNFWASWCPPCRAEHPTLTALADADVPLYGVNYRDRIDHALAFLEELGNPYDRLGRDETARNGRDWGVVAMPETFFIDGDGNIVLHFRGPVIARSLEAQIRPALAAQGHSLPDIPGLTP